MNKNILYDKRTAGGMEYLIPLIDDVFDNYEGVRWSPFNHEEYGCNYHHKQSGSIIFLGIWYEAWRLFEMPLCISVDWRGHAPYEMATKIKKFVSGLSEAVTYRNLNEYSVILFEEKFFDFESDLERICKLYKKTSNFIFPDRKF